MKKHTTGNLRKLINDITTYIFSNSIYWALFFITQLIIARILEPAKFSAWNVFSFILLNSSYINLGIQNAFERDLIEARMRNDQQRIIAISNTTFSFLIFSSLTIGSLFGIIIYISARSPILSTPLFILLTPVIILLYQFDDFFIRYWRGMNDFLTISIFKATLACVICLLMISLIHWFSFSGIPLAICIGNCIVLCAAFIVKRMRFCLTFDFALIKELLFKGLPMIISSSCATIFFTIERIFVFNALPPEQSGYYAICSTVITFTLLLSSSFANVIFIHFSEQYDSQLNYSALNIIIRTSTISLFCFSVLYTVLLMIIFPFLINYFIPQYSPAILAVFVNLISAIFISIAILLRRFLLTLRKLSWYIYITISMLGCKILALLYSLKYYNSILSVSYVTLVCSIIFSITLWFYTCYELKENIVVTIMFRPLYIPYVLKPFRKGICVSKNNFLWHYAWKIYLQYEWQSLKLHITDECNLACNHCYISNKNRNKLSLSTIDTIFSQLDIRNNIRLDILGGEPLVYDELLTLISTAKKFKYIKHIQLYTNATLIDSSIAANLKKAGVDSIIVSFFTDSEESFEYNTQTPGSWQHMLTGIKHLVNNEIVTYGLVVVSAHNHNHLDHIEQFAHSLHINTIYFPYIQQNHNDSLCITPDASYRSAVKWIFQKSNAFQKKLLKYMCRYNTLCDAFPRSLSIMADGTIRPCPFAHLSLGNVYIESLRTVIENMPNNKSFLDFYVLPEKCHSCTLKRTCGGGCKSITYHANHYGLTHSSYSCRGPIHQMIHNKDLGSFLPFIE